MLGFAGVMAIETKVGQGAVTVNAVDALIAFDVAEMVAVP
jgi:hypothetical protein